MTLLVVDNFDSFTHMLVDYLRQAGATCHIVRNNEPMSRLTAQAVDGVVLSPGPGQPAQAGRLLEVIAYYHQRLPMLGVCLGHQAIGTFFGATLQPAPYPMHGKVSPIRVLTDDPLFGGMPTRFGVTRYHSLVLTGLPDTLTWLALTDRHEGMALRHRTLPLWGVQFHPEAALTEFGLSIVSNWINFVKISIAQSEKAIPAALLQY